MSEDIIEKIVSLSKFDTYKCSRCKIANKPINQDKAGNLYCNNCSEIEKKLGKSKFFS